MYCSATSAATLLNHSASAAPMNIEIELKPLIVNASPSPVADGMNFFSFGNASSSSGSTMPSEGADHEPDARGGVQRADALRQQLGDAAPHQRGGRGPLLGAEHRRVRDQDEEHRHHHERARQHAEELGEELLARVGAEQVAALQVGEQVAGVAAGAGGDVRGHQVGRDVARRDRAEGELRDLAERPDRRDVGLAGRARAPPRPAGSVTSTAITPIHQWMWKMQVPEADHGGASTDERRR